MAKIEVTEFHNRFTEEHPAGFIEFNDGMRIGYAPGTRQADEDGLFNCQQLYELRDRDLRWGHIEAAKAYVRNVLTRKKYRVEALPVDDEDFVLRIHGLPDGTQNITNAPAGDGEQGVETVARKFIALVLKIDEKSFDLEIEIENPEGESDE